jgi:hypothetical protein
MKPIRDRNAANARNAASIAFAVRQRCPPALNSWSSRLAGARGRPSPKAARVPVNVGSLRPFESERLDDRLLFGVNEKGKPDVRGGLGAQFATERDSKFLLRLAEAAAIHGSTWSISSMNRADGEGSEGDEENRFLDARDISWGFIKLVQKKEKTMTERLLLNSGQDRRTWSKKMRTLEGTRREIVSR